MDEILLFILFDKNIECVQIILTVDRRLLNEWNGDSNPIERVEFQRISRSVSWLRKL